MKKSYLITAALAASLMTGCVNVKVSSCDCKPKHHEGKEHEGKEHEDKDEEDEHEGKGRHEGKEKEEDDEKEGKESEAHMKARAKLTESDARKIAMAKVPNGTIKEGELEMEKGKLQWSFDISTPGTKDITEVNINAITGEIISIDKETPADQAKEKDEDEKEKK